MPIRELDPEVVRKLIAGVEDVLTPMAKEMERLQTSVICPRCGESMHIELNKEIPFMDNGIARTMGICDTCGHVIDISSGLSLVEV